MSLARFMRWPVIITLVACVAGAIIGGPKVAVLLALLCVLEISISFDNAIVNATVLRTMNEKWQKIFLTWGILIAVFGMRLIFPIVIVAAAAGLSIPDVLDMAINDSDGYAEQLEASNAVIAGFGGTFLLMVFLSYFFDDEKEDHWTPFERHLATIGKVSGVSVAVALGGLLAVTGLVVSADHQLELMVSGVAGIVCYLLVGGFADMLAPDDLDKRDVTATVGKAGFASFLYLEILDASFSFDGVIGAFAISKNIFIIAVGLGVGALYIRSLTVYLVRQGTLSEYRYLEPGAHWAIGSLAIILLISVEAHVPELITGTLSAVIILLAFWHSVIKNRSERANGGDDDGDAGSGSPDVELAKA